MSAARSIRAAGIARLPAECPRIGVREDRRAFDRCSGCSHEACCSACRAVVLGHGASGWPRRRPRRADAQPHRPPLRAGGAAPPRRRDRLAPARSSSSRRRRGTFEIETYPNEAPKSVEHILALVKRNFYNGLRVHRVVPGFVVQFGDPQTRDMTKRDRLGHRRQRQARSAWPRSARSGRTGSAPSRSPTPAIRAAADSQMYICRERPGALRRDRGRLHRLRPGHLRHGRRAEARG